MRKVLIIEIIVFLLLIGLTVCALTGVFSREEAPVETTAPTEETLPQFGYELVVPPMPKATWETFRGRELTCRGFFAYDCEEDKMLAQYGNGTKIYSASITKLLTAYTALQYLEATDKVVAGDALSMVAADSSVAFIRWGDTLTVEQLVEAMLLPSGNDASYITAVAAGREIAGNSELSAREAVDVFVKQMNTVAKNAGMTSSNFVNPDGYHSDNHYTCFRDLAILGELAMTNELIVKYATMPEGNNPNFSQEQGIPQWENTNFLIHPDNDFYCSYAKGLKTGNTSLAGKCLLSAFNYEGRKIVIGVFGCPDYDDRFIDTLYIFSRVIGAIK
jgi:D-alanyl-D-alanine carboxypeptidase (penicillin-binding protein 5/6)